ncbi:MAG: hypothetical protein Q9N02_07720, partial [Ghiorsea sp.]|nr:hypothetical protein [Ghiorsea sp.]
QAKKEDKRQQIAAAQAATFEGVATEWLAKKEQQLKSSTIKHRKSALANHGFLFKTGHPMDRKNNA